MGPGMTWLETAPDYHAQTTIVLFERSRMEKANPQVSTAHPSVMFTCADIEGEHRRLLSNGVIVDDIQKYPYGRMFSLYDHGSPGVSAKRSIRDKGESLPFLNNTDHALYKTASLQLMHAFISKANQHRGF